MSTRATYTARCRREPNGWWFIEVPGVEGGYTQARSLDQAEHMVRDLLALLLEVPEDAFDVILEPVLPDELAAELEEARGLRRSADSAQEVAGVAVHRVIAHLAAAQLSIRDIGRLVDLSHQRISQLLSPPTSAAPRVTRRHAAAATATTRRTSTSKDREPTGSPRHK